MRIGYDAKRFFHNLSGLGNYSRDLIRILALYFPEHEYLLFSKNLGKQGEDLLDLPAVFFEKTDAKFLSRQLSWGRRAQESICDIFHGLSGELPLSWGREPIKKVVSVHDLIFIRYPHFYSFFDRKIHYLKLKRSCVEADLVVAISQQTQQDLIRFLGVPEEKIRLIYQACHPAFKELYTDGDLAGLRKKFNLPQRFILNVGTIEKRKNLMSVLEAIVDTDVALVAVGKKTAYYKSVKRFITKNGMDHRVSFLEGVSTRELAGIYRMADIFVYPSLFEGFGIPIIEALFSKTPVIAGNNSALSEAGGQHSLYVDPLDAGDLKEKILFLWENKAQRLDRAERSFGFVQKFRDEVIAKEMMSLYQEVLDR